MAKNLVIVESPAKVKTIKKFLGANYEVLASNGHVRDLPKSRMGIEVDDDFEPKYITIRGKGDILAALRKEAKKAEKIYLATDPDREGEAISWHLLEALKLHSKPTYRITFNEITKNAIRDSFKNAREINKDLVDAQQARRMLDRMVGYKISPLLWAKIKRGLSAGRVQSVALRIICDREEEIAAFEAREYWTLETSLKVPSKKTSLVAKYYGTNGKKAEWLSQQEVEEILVNLKNLSYHVDEVKVKERTKNPPLPFTTSTMQQEASKVLNFSTQKTMRLAQQLYEGVDIKGDGTVGIITYLRTDSTRVSEESDLLAQEYIQKRYGQNYVLSSPKEAKSNQKIQDAHEAIRPTDIKRTPESIKESLSRDQYRLYQLIWKRFVASRMSAATYETTTAEISAGEYQFRASAGRLCFDGFINVYKDEDDKEEKNAMLAGIEKGMQLACESQSSEQHFTQPPAHYTEASLVKAMEELGIGRPSTYSPTISTIIARRYVIRENKNIYVSELGEVVNAMMKEAFPSIVDVNFTATMEGLLDKVEEGTVGYKTIVSNFYPDLEEAVVQATDQLKEYQVEDEVSEEVCELCGRNMVVKYGPHGKFLACPGFPECRNTKTYLERIGVACPKCGKDVVVRKTKKGRRYYGCEGNPECDYMVWQKPVNENDFNA